MKYLHRFARLPKDKELLRNIERCTSLLSKNILKINHSETGMSDYGQRSLVEHQSHIRGTMMVLTYLIAWALDRIDKPLSEITLLDYGAGLGYVGLIAKKMGVGTVIYNDIFENTRQDAEKLAPMLGVVPDHYITGGINEIVKYREKKDLSVDIIISNNVLEHIYGLETNFEMLRQISDGNLIAVMSTSANDANPKIRKDHFNFHHQVEYEGREAIWGYRSADSTQAYLEMRKDMIREYSSDLPDDIVDKLAVLTRGKRIDHIHQDVETYIKRNIFPVGIDHPTNTCDPVNGNWQERLLTAQQYLDRYRNAGYKASVLPGYYRGVNNIVKETICAIANAVISISGPRGLHLSPYVAFIAEKKV